MNQKSERRLEDRKRSAWLRDLAILERRVTGRTHSILPFIIIALLVATSFSVIPPLWHNGSSHVQITPAASTGVAASVGVSASYYTLSGESNTAYTFKVPLCQNTTFSQIPAFSSSLAWTKESSTVASWTQDFASPSTGALYIGMFRDEINVELDQAAFKIGSAVISDSIVAYIGTVYANLTAPDGSTYTWSHVFDDCASVYANTFYAYVDPQWTVYGSPYTEQVGGWSVAFSDVLPSGYSWYTMPSGMTSDTGSQTNSVSSSATGSNTAINGIIGFHYEPETCVFNIPSDEASYDVVFGSPSISEISAEYCGSSTILTASSPSTAGLLSGTDAIRFVTGSVSGDPNPGGSGATATSDTAVTYSITLENQEQASLNNVASYYSSSISYTPANPSPNEFTYAIPFSFSTPSGAYFGPYESGTNSLTTGTAAFVPDVTVSDLEQVDYGCTQAAFFVSLNNGSYAQQSNEQYHTYTYSSTYSSSQTIDNYIQTISAANTAPGYKSSYLDFTGTGSEAELYFNITQPDFAGEAESVTILWGDGQTSTSTGTSLSLVFTHSYASTGTFTISAEFENTPSTTLGGLSSLSGPTQVYTWQVSIGVSITPPYGTALTTGEGVTMHFTAVHDIVGSISAYDSGSEFLTHTFNAGSGSLTMYPPSAGLTGFTLTIDFDGAFYSVQYQFSAPLYPSLNATFAVEIGANSLTKQYPISVTNTGSTSTGSSTMELEEASSYWSAYLNPDLSNVLFRYANGSLIPSMLVTYSSTNAEWYLGIYSLSPGASANMLQIFYPTAEAVFINTTLPVPTAYLDPAIGSVENSTIVNSSNLSFVHYSSVASYPPSPMNQSFTYFIPNYFNFRYVQINYNDSWLYQYSSPTYVSQDLSYNSEVLFSNVTGVSEFTLSFAQPSTLIGTPVEVSIQLQDGNQTINAGDLSEFIIQDRYTPFGTSGLQYLNESSEYFMVPFGSVDRFYILDPWNAVVGISSSVLIDGSSFSFVIQLLLTLVTVQFVNTSATTIHLSQNGIAATFNSYLAFYVANSSSYTWFTDIFDASLGHNVNYSGTFRSDAPSETLWVNVTAPLAQVTVSVNAYTGSGAGPLFSYPPDNVTLNINGIDYQIDEPLTFQVGEALNMKVLDPLGAVMAQDNITVGGTIQSFTLQIGTPSYELSFRNDEQAAPGSQLATEYINVSEGSQAFVFTDMVGDTASLYLAAGTYHLYLHDNATFSTNITLSENQNYVIFGQQLLTSQQFNSRIGQIYNSTDHFSIVPKNVPSLIQTGSPVSLDFGMYCSNGTPLTIPQVRQFVSNSTVTLESGSLSVPLSVTETSYLVINFTAPASSGSYVLFIEGYLSSGGSTISAEYSIPITFQASVQVGMQMTLTVSAQIEAKTLTNGTVNVEYGNGTSLDSRYTRSVLANLTILIYRNGNLIATAHPYYVAPGIIGFGLNISATGNSYTIYANVSRTLIAGSYAFASAHSGFAVVGYNPTTGPPNSVSQIGAYLSNNIDLLASIIGVLAAAYYVIRFFRRRSLTRKSEENTAGLNIESTIIEKVLAGIPLTPTEQVIYDKIPKDELNRIINLATSGKIRQIKEKAKKVKKQNENV